ncbi:adenylosuccinate synthetase [Nocardiopsis sp. LOL_012]|uniref:adenylosuccinate synthetase n=1 Tax=Nocardiopsis sp. LOL_012 TaxID=3345409 RepID=UPI003A86D992
MTGTPWADEHAIVTDLGFGDAGKGVTVDLMCARRRFGAVVRANGGAQAAHNVVAPDCRHHTFSQFGAGTLAPDGPVPTHLSRFMVVDPFALAAEAAHLAALGVADPLSLVTVDRRALVSTPWHQARGRARERARGAGRHGSCGMGVGETMAYALAHPGDAPTVGDCAEPARLRRKLALLAEHLAEAAGPDPAEPSPDPEECVAAYWAFASAVRLVDEGYLADLLAASPVVFEGAQGVLLDEWHGFHPHTTWSTTTTANPLTLLAEAGQADRARRIGVVRTYTTRHGAGPLVAEDPALGAVLAERHNGTHPWQGPFRVGPFDLVAHRYALAATGGADTLVVTHADAPDRIREATGAGPRWCTGYTDAGGAPLEIAPPEVPDLARQERVTAALTQARPALETMPDDPVAAIGGALGLPVEAVFSGPTREDARVPSRV